MTSSIGTHSSSLTHTEAGMSHLKASTEIIPRTSSPSPRSVTTLAVINGDNANGGNTPQTSTETVRIFKPDDIIQQHPPSASGTPPFSLKSSIKGNNTIAMTPNGVKVEDKSYRELGRGISSAAKSNSSSNSLAAESKRSHHQRSLSHGLSIPANSELPEKYFAGENRGGSQTYGSRPFLTSSSNTHQGSSSPLNHGSSHGRGHRRQHSMGRDQRQVNFCPYDGYCFVLDEHRCAVCGEERGSLPAPMYTNVQPWKKVLYEKQGFEDNYTDRDTFLAELKKNVNVEEYSYQLVMADSLVVTQQLSVLVLFVAVFMHTMNGSLTANAVGILDIITALGGYLIWAACRINHTSEAQLLSLASVAKLVGYGLGLYILSPVLAALTDPISDDTIAALSIILLVIHLSFQDYGYLNPEQIIPRNADVKSQSSRLSGEFVARARRGSYGEFTIAAPASPLYHAPVSLNAAIFASLLMASRLQSHSHAFVVIAFAVEIFALFPIMAHHLKAYSWWGSFLLVFGLVASAIFLISSLSTIVTYIYIGTIVFATFISPFCLQWIQRYKNEIHGPWDEAVPARARRHGTRQ